MAVPAACWRTGVAGCKWREASDPRSPTCPHPVLSKHNGQPVAEPGGGGAEGICGKGHSLAMARGYLGMVALRWCGSWENPLEFFLPFACDCPPTTVVILHAETGRTTVLSPVAAAGPIAYGQK